MSPANQQNALNALNQYKKVGLHGGVESASPHRLIQMMFEGALEKIQTAKTHIENNEIAGKGEQISWAISIIDGLRVSLDKSAGGDIAENLDMLYDYMSRRLLEANLNSDVTILDEVAGLISEIKSAWDVIPPDAAAPQSTGV